jgi:hypothetical protein
MAPSSSNSHQPAGSHQAAVGFGRGIIVGFISAMIGFLLMQKIINLHTHHVASSFDTGIHKQQGDMLEPTITLPDVSRT